MTDKKIWEEIDFIDSIEELNKHVGSMVYILLYSNNIIGSTKLSDVNKFMESEDILNEYVDDTEGVMLLHALVLNHKELPENIPSDLVIHYNVACLKANITNTIEFEEQTTIDDVIDFIEFEMEASNLDIDDFAVIVYKKVDFTLQCRVPDTVMTVSHRRELGVYK